MNELARILVPVDGSPSSEEAVSLAALLASSVGATVDILHVTYFDSDTDDEKVSWLPESVAAPMGPKTDALFARAKGIIAGRAAAEYHRRTGSPGEEIIAFAREGKTDLIVMGSRRLDPLKAAFLGSISMYVMKSATCPVTIVKEKQDI